ncbi:MAG: 50S ribosomal protein L15 [Bacteroidota bacterium]
MQLNTLRPATGSTKVAKRIGRGQGSGRGGTSTKGHKGARSRSGYKRKIGFEGGQLPLQRRLPRAGFKNFNKTTCRAINLATLQALAAEYQLDTIDAAVLAKHGWAHASRPYKILGGGALQTRLSVSAHAFSATAKASIQEQGGEATLIKTHA